MTALTPVTVGVYLAYLADNGAPEYVLEYVKEQNK